MIIKNKMAVICRTKEEQEVYVEIATREGWKSVGARALHTNHTLPMNYATGYFDEKYPNAITNGSANQRFPEDLTVVEASDLFHNQLISRRRKHENRTA